MGVLISANIEDPHEMQHSTVCKSICNGVSSIQRVNPCGPQVKDYTIQCTEYILWKHLNIYSIVWL